MLILNWILKLSKLKLDRNISVTIMAIIKSGVGGGCAYVENLNIFIAHPRTCITQCPHSEELIPLGALQCVFSQRG